MQAHFPSHGVETEPHSSAHFVQTLQSQAHPNLETRASGPVTDHSSQSDSGVNCLCSPQLRPVGERSRGGEEGQVLLYFSSPASGGVSHQPPSSCLASSRYLRPPSFAMVSRETAGAGRSLSSLGVHIPRWGSLSQLSFVVTTFPLQAELPDRTQADPCGAPLWVLPTCNRW